MTMVMNGQGKRSTRIAMDVARADTYLSRMTDEQLDRYFQALHADINSLAEQTRSEFASVRQEIGSLRQEVGFVRKELASFRSGSEHEFRLLNERMTAVEQK